MFGPIGLNHGINFNKMKELETFRKFLNENLDEISLRGLMGRDMKGEDLAADPKKLEKTLSKIMKYIGDPSVTDQVRDWLKMDVQEFPDVDYANPETLELTAKAAAYYVGQEDEPNIDVPPLEENDKALDEVLEEEEVTESHNANDDIDIEMFVMIHDFLDKNGNNYLRAGLAEWMRDNMNHDMLKAAGFTEI